MVADKYSAGSKLIGYFYQVYYALYLLLREKEMDNITIAIENLDDVDFEKDGDPRDLIQFKHHIKRQGTLGNRSSDIWKTIRIWAERVNDKVINPEEVKCILITTTVASKGSVAYQLKSLNNRDVDEITNKLSKIATESNKVNQAGYDAFLKLDITMRKKLVDSIIIIDNAPMLNELDKYLKTELRNTIHPDKVSSFLERLEGWWLKRVMEVLWNQSNEIESESEKELENKISRKELDLAIQNIRDDFRREALPDDFSSAIPPENDDVWNPNNTFLKQLDLLYVKEDRKKKAIYDYYRAYNQRSKWSREELIGIIELQEYDGKLTEEWEEMFNVMLEDLEFEANTENNKIREGRKLYSWATQDAHKIISIRSDWKEPFLLRGSYHMLADSISPKVGWHPDFENILYGYGGIIVEKKME